MNPTETPEHPSLCLIREAKVIRHGLLSISEDVYRLGHHEHFKASMPPALQQLPFEQQQRCIREVAPNIMLAYRHLEDARMRLGKLIQALEGGVSVYDK